MAPRLSVSQILASGNAALAAGVAAEARHRGRVRVLLEESRVLRAHLAQAPGDDLRTSIEGMLRRADEALDRHRRQNLTIARLRDLLRRAKRREDEPGAEIELPPSLFEVLSPFVDHDHMPDCRSAEAHLRRAVRSGTIGREGIAGHLAALCATPDRGF